MKHGFEIFSRESDSRIANVHLISKPLCLSLYLSLPNDRHVYKLSDLVLSCFISLLPRFELVMT